MTIFGENFFKIFNLHRDIQVNKTTETQNVKAVEKPDQVDSDKDREHESQAGQHPACISCPSLDTKEHCNDCLAIRDIYA